MSDDPGIELSDLIRHLREELQQTMREGADEELRFRLQDIELDLQVAVSREMGGKVGAKGKVRFWVFDADAEAEASGKWSTSRLQKVKLRLAPVAKDEDGNETGHVDLKTRR